MNNRISYDSPIGPLEFENGFESGAPAARTGERLREAFDVNNASTVYAWSLPLVASYQIKEGLETSAEARDGDIVYFRGADIVRPFLTSNNTTPYIISVMDLGRTGPMVIEVPPGQLLGFANDAWQRHIRDIGVTGPAAGKGERVVLVGPGQDAPQDAGDVVRSDTNFVFWVYRVLDPDPAEADRLLQGVRHYPYETRAQPQLGRVIMLDQPQTWRQSQKRGMEFWRVLNTALQNEPVDERDRFFHGMLGYLGIAKGEDFSPTPQQVERLEQGAFLGEAMVKAFTFEKRFASRVWREGSNWEIMLNMNANQRTEHTEQFEERAAWFYEATTMSPSYEDKTVGSGTKYLTTYKAGNGDWLDGAEDYVLHVPADVPVKLFWDVSVYEVDGRIYITNETGVVNLGLRSEGLSLNEDGTTDIYFGPEVPKGAPESNWIQTVPGQNWLAVFRFYGPLEPYYDGTFTLPDVQPC